jgi:hypothetical protein
MLLWPVLPSCDYAALAAAVPFCDAGVDIREAALKEVACDSYTARQEAQQYGTDLNRQLFDLQSKLMIAVTKEFLRSDACANSQDPKPTAYMQYVMGMVQAGG